MTKETIQIHIANDPMYVENGMTVYVRDGGPCWVIDPGLPPQAQQIVEHIREHKLELTAILLTHAHADHIAGIDEVRDILGPVPVHLGKQEWPALTDPEENLSARIGAGFATHVDDPQDLPPGDTLTLDGTEWQILDTSGHSPGGRSFYCAGQKIVIVGDALFQGSIGRVDFHHSDGDTLMRNLHSHLMTLPDETRVLSGHGPDTTIGQERATNPFLIHGL
jgi:glyoxylase-like metal-dependent hydrolase (beta-lactamase superfamily II)